MNIFSIPTLLLSATFFLAANAIASYEDLDQLRLMQQRLGTTKGVNEFQYNRWLLMTRNMIERMTPEYQAAGGDLNKRFGWVVNDINNLVNA